MADETRRWFADSSVSYALAAIALLEYAREHRVKYVFGPLEVRAMLDGGLVVSGSPDGLAHAVKVLSAIPGLAEWPAGLDQPGMSGDWVVRNDGGPASEWAVRETPETVGPDEPTVSEGPASAAGGEAEPPASGELRGVEPRRDAYDSEKLVVLLRGDAGGLV